MKKLPIYSLLILLLLTLQPGFCFAQDDEKPELKPQAELAAKEKAFAKVEAGNATVKAAKDVRDLEMAKSLIGKNASFVGTVTQVFLPRGNALVLLNFAREYKTALVGVVYKEDFARFPDLTRLKGKKVLLTGKIIDFKGRPEIELTSLESIKIVE